MPILEFSKDKEGLALDEAQCREAAERCTPSADLQDVAPGELRHLSSYHVNRAPQPGHHESLCPHLRPSSLRIL